MEGRRRSEPESSEHMEGKSCASPICEREEVEEHESASDATLSPAHNWSANETQSDAHSETGERVSGSTGGAGGACTMRRSASTCELSGMR